MGPNLVTNGTFNTDTTGWTAATGTIASVGGGVNGNCAQVSTGSDLNITQMISGLTPGKLYRCGFWMKNGTVTGPQLGIGVTTGGRELGCVGLTPGLNLTSWTYYQMLFEATQVTIYISLGVVNTGNTLFDSITLTEVTVGCVDYDTKALDLWSKDVATACWRETNQTKGGSYYALRVYGGCVYWSDGGRAARPEFYSRYADAGAVVKGA